MVALHAAMELVGAILCLSIAWFYRDCWKQFPSALLLLWALGWGLTCGEDLIHASGALFSAGTLTASWVPWTWATSRFTLAAILVFGLVGSKRKSLLNTTTAIAFTGALFTISILLLGVGADFEFVYNDVYPYRRLDAVLAFVYLAVWGLFLTTPVAQVQVPRWAHLSILLGIASHVVMTFSQKSLDATFMWAHVFKLAEYATWSASLWFYRKEFRAHVRTRATELAIEQPEVVEEVIRIGFPELLSEYEELGRARREATKKFLKATKMIQTPQIPEDGTE